VQAWNIEKIRLQLVFIVVIFEAMIGIFPKKLGRLSGLVADVLVDTDT
jgi:hypothetical membrane protein